MNENRSSNTSSLHTRLLQKLEEWRKKPISWGLIGRSLLAGTVALGISGIGGITKAPSAYDISRQPSAISEAVLDAGQRDATDSWIVRLDGEHATDSLPHTVVLGSQLDESILWVKPSDSVENTEAWLRELHDLEGVVYVHPNNRVKVASLILPEAEQLDDNHVTAVEGDMTTASVTGKDDTEAGNDSDKDLSNDIQDERDLSVDKSGSEGKVSDQTTQDGGAAGGNSNNTEAVQPSPPAQTVVEQEAAIEEAQASKAAIVRQAASSPTDPEIGKQNYLNLIGAKKAWETVREQTDLTIAIVDTGIDLDHPDLKENLVPGVNLLNKNKSANDDSGHGTSVAGIIGAVGDNNIGITGILWKAKLMPIKALDSEGNGTEQDLGEGILYAVNNGADIVVLSVGLHRYSPYMLDIVQYAENKGVLLVAAAGNDGGTFGSRAEVKYPAAYPSVLAVGGIQSNLSVEPRSNPGPELDLVAPWDVFTTNNNGGYWKQGGTSMAAPQVAAAAALVWKRQPDLEPYQVRELLRQTARNIGSPGVDDQTGYGLLQIDKAVSSTLKPDANEPNNTMQTATKFPLFSSVIGELTKGGDVDWFRIVSPYEGTIAIKYESLLNSELTTPPISITHYSGGKQTERYDTKLATGTAEFAVKKGEQFIQLRRHDPNEQHNLPYRLTSHLTMKPDAYEPNDRAYEAYTLQPRSQSITGNFHKKGDRDWFAITFTQSGKLNLSVSTNTMRIDPAIALQQAGQAINLFDEMDEGVTEKSPTITVSPGKYYIRVHNAISSEASPTVGTYTLDIQFEPIYEDPNEPNDRTYEALLVKGNTEYLGVIGTKNDVDWFQYRITEPTIISAEVDNVPTNVNLKLELFTRSLQPLTNTSTGKTGKLQTATTMLQPGLYYVKLSADRAFNQQYYYFKLNAVPYKNSFNDLKGHWAESEVAVLQHRGIVSGTGKGKFEPKRSITRAEAVSMIVKAYDKGNSSGGNRVSFKDVSTSHWAYSAISQASKNGWVDGFLDGSFKPNALITRAEMAILLGKAKGIKPVQPSSDPFVDVSKTNWAAPMLHAMKNQSLVKGSGSNQYHPSASATRAEFSVLLYRSLYEL